MGAKVVIFKGLMKGYTSFLLSAEPFLMKVEALSKIAFIQRITE
jgi:hypothetical protein